MRHRKSGVKLNRTTSHRQAMFRNMVTSLLKYERIQTTDVKAKELRRWADHIITLAKRGDLHARRQAMAIVREKDIVHKLFEEAGKRFGNLNGGYTRIVKIGHRPGDAAPISMIELVAADETEKKTKKKAKGPAKKKAKDVQPVPEKKETGLKEEPSDTSASAEVEQTEVQPSGPEDVEEKMQAKDDEPKADAEAQADAPVTEDTPSEEPSEVETPETPVEPEKKQD